MIVDKLLEIADAASVANTAASTYLIGSQIDLQEIGRDIGQGQPLYLIITVDTSIITAGSAGTIQFKLVSDDSASISTSTSTVHWASKLFVTDDDALNDLDAGAIIVVPLPAGLPGYERYLGLLYAVGTTDTSAGKINAFLSLDPTGNKAYPNGQV